MVLNVKALDERHRLEVYAVIYFIGVLRRSYNRRVKFRGLGRPPHPDILCLIDGHTIGIEVAHLYGSERNARMLLGRSRDIEMEMEQRAAHSRVPLGSRIPNDLNRILICKAGKKYPGESWLLIRNAFPLWNRTDFEQYLTQIEIPEKHPFSEIWLLCDRTGSSGALKLFPP